MEQYLGRVCTPTVCIGDFVRTGDVIAVEVEKGVPPVHSSVSGKVVDIAGHIHPYGHRGKCIYIESDGMDTWNSQKLEGPVAEVIHQSGILEAYGLSKTIKSQRADTVLLNGTDHRPYVFVDRVIMMEEKKGVVRGLQLLMEAVGAKKGVIGINAFDTDLLRTVGEEALNHDIQVVPLKMVYTRGMGRLLSRDVSRKLKSDLNRVLVSTVSTARAVYQAVAEGKPFVEAYLSVHGAARTDAVKARIGTSFKEVIEAVGGYTGTPNRIVMNSPMTGVAQYTDEVPVIRSTHSLIVQYDASVEEPGPCIRCASCVDVCPVNLLPNMLTLYSKKNKFEECRRYHVSACIECGYCSYVCPSKIPIMQLIRYAKANLEGVS